MNSRIKYARIEDVERIYEILKEGNRTAYTIDLVRDLIVTKGSLSLVLLIDNNIVGALGEGQKEGILYGYTIIIIHRDYRGMNYASELVDKFFDDAKKRGIKRVALDTPDEIFFENFGFKEVGRILNWYEDKDQIIMYRGL